MLTRDKDKVEINYWGSILSMKKSCIPGNCERQEEEEREGSAVGVTRTELAAIEEGSHKQGMGLMQGAVTP